MCQISFSVARFCPNVLKFCTYYKRHVFSPLLLHMYISVSYPLMHVCLILGHNNFTIFSTVQM